MPSGPDHFKEPFFCTLLSFSLNTAAYTAETLAGHPRDTRARSRLRAPWAWARGADAPHRAAQRHTPHAAAYGNEVVMMLHSSSLASTVPLLDLTGAASRVYADFYLPFEAYLFAAAIYLCITLCLLECLQTGERRFGYLAPRKNLNP
jgi:arginine/ornithine transport system permease protein